MASSSGSTTCGGMAAHRRFSSALSRWMRYRLPGKWFSRVQHQSSRARVDQLEKAAAGPDATRQNASEAELVAVLRELLHPRYLIEPMGLTDPLLEPPQGGISNGERITIDWIVEGGDSHEEQTPRWRRDGTAGHGPRQGKGRQRRRTSALAAVATLPRRALATPTQTQSAGSEQFHLSTLAHRCVC